MNDVCISAAAIERNTLNSTGDMSVQIQSAVEHNTKITYRVSGHDADCVNSEWTLLNATKVMWWRYPYKFSFIRIQL